MKRLFTAIALAASLCTQASAQSEFRDRHMAYKGFADVGLSSAFYGGDNAYSFSFTTSHGMQFNPTFFLGAGIGVSASTGGFCYAPIYGHVRYNLLERQISPYIDFKGGGIVGNIQGGYLEPSFGVSMPVTNRIAIDFALAYSLYTESGDCLHGLSLKFGFEF